MHIYTIEQKMFSVILSCSQCQIHAEVNLALKSIVGEIKREKFCNTVEDMGKVHTLWKKLSVGGILAVLYALAWGQWNEKDSSNIL
jgi:hypothetical protein